MSKKGEKKADPGLFLLAFAASLLPSLIICAAYLLGLATAQGGLTDPDSCWLLALGGDIVSHKALPASDPYSWTMPLHGNGPFVMYQWLSELAMYSLSSLSGLTGLLLWSALLLTNTFIVIPLAFARKLGCSNFLSLGLVVVAVFAALPRYIVRPEIASYFFLVTWLIMIARMRINSLSPINDWTGPSARASAQNASGDTAPSASSGESKQAKGGTVFALASSEESVQRKSWTPVAFAALLMMLWGNFHSAFVLGLFFLLLEAAFASLEWLAISGHGKFPHTKDWIALAVSLTATFINPQGVSLWGYLPRLFSSPVNEIIRELKPMSLTDLTHWHYYPFFILIIISIVLISKRIWQSRDLETFRLQVGFFTPCAVFVVIAMALAYRRLIGFAVCVVLVQVLACCSNARSKEVLNNSKGKNKAGNARSSAKASQEKKKVPKFSSTGKISAEFEQWLEKIYGTKQRWWLIAVNAAAAAAVLAQCAAKPPTLPQAGPGFTPPFHALTYLKEHPINGRLFNDAQFGDTIIWYFGKKLPVFIDTRFDMYGTDIVHDYADIYFCRHNWESLLAKYRIDCVFLPPRADLAMRLQHDGNWLLLYQDEVSVIFRRNGP